MSRQIRKPTPTERNRRTQERIRKKEIEDFPSGASVTAYRLVDDPVPNPGGVPESLTGAYVELTYNPGANDPESDGRVQGNGWESLHAQAMSFGARVFGQKCIALGYDSTAGWPDESNAVNGPQNIPFSSDPNHWDEYYGGDFDPTYRDESGRVISGGPIGGGASDNSIVIGSQSRCNSDFGTVLGPYSSCDAGAANSTVIGSYSGAIGGSFSVVLGNYSYANAKHFGGNSHAIAIGNYCGAGHSFAIAIGSYCEAYHSDSLAIGYQVGTQRSSSVALGYSSGQSDPPAYEQWQASGTSETRLRGNVVIGELPWTGAAATKLGFYGTAAIAKPTVTGSRGGNAALASLLTALANLGLITDSSA